MKTTVADMMKTTLWQLLIGVIVLTASAQAQLQDVAITVTRKKLDEQKSRQSMETVTTREYAYTVILSSHSFKSLPMVEVKYMIFYEDAQPGRKEKPDTLHVKGKETLANLENNRPVSFETQPVKLSNSALDGNAYWASGAKSQTRDAVTGMWIRVYSEGKLVGEYVNPSTTSKKNDWKE